MSGTADYIREAREQKGLTLTQVEEATRIPRYYLEILEGGGDERLVSDRLYMVHFLRSYASFLEVEEETLAVQFVRENRERESKEVVPIPEHRSWKGFAMAALALLLMSGIGVYLYDSTLLDISGSWTERIVASPAPAPAEAPAQRTLPTPAIPPETDDTESSVLQPEANETTPSAPKLVTTPTPPAEVVPGLEPVAPLQDRTAVPGDAVSTEAPDTSRPSPAQDASTPRAEETTAASSGAAEPPEGGTEQADDATAPASPAVAALSAPPDTDAADAPAKHNLTIVADQQSWLRVWVDGEQPRDMLLAPGASRTLPAQTGYVITFGNAGGVRLTLNGEELPSAGKSGQVVRGFKLPPEG